MKRTLICIAIVLSAVAPAEARTVELTLHPAKIAESPQEYLLLPSVGKLTDADAAPLYEEAIQAMPKDINQMQIREWMKLPIEQFPQKKAEAVIQKCVESLRLVTQAARCRECNWTKLKLKKPPNYLLDYGQLTFILELLARLEVSRGQYKDALAAIQTGFGMARHLEQGPSYIQVLAGSVIEGIMYKEVEQFIQQKDSPNLYRALANFPRPLVDLEMVIKSELTKLKNTDASAREKLEKKMKEFRDRIRMVEQRANTRLNALQCLEAIRDYAAAHDGRLPKTLSDISNLDVPKDAMTGKVFKYHHTAAGAVLQPAVPKNSKERNAIRYEIIMKR